MSIFLDRAERARNGRAIALLFSAMNPTHRYSPSRRKAVWGEPAFQEGAELLVRFAFETVGVHRLEVRAAVLNGRGNGALRKMGAVQEGLLRKSFLKNGEYLDQPLWTILDEDWNAKKIWDAKEGMIIH